MSPSKLDLKKRRIREFFSTFKPKKKHKDKEIDDFWDDILEECMVYIQMRFCIHRR